MSAMISLKASRNTLHSQSTSNVQVHNTVNIEHSGADDDIKVHYDNECDDTNPYTSLTLKQLSLKVEDLQSLVDVQKCVIQMMMDNPFKYNGYIIADDTTLIKFIRILTKANDVEIDAEDLGEGCMTRKIYRKINSIYCVYDDGRIENAKYAHADVMKLLKDMRISTKFVY